MAPLLDAIKRRRYVASVSRWSGLWLLVLAASLTARSARADAMDLRLERLSRGACARTLAGASDFALRESGAQLLAPDQATYGLLVSELSAALTPALLAPVTTRGPSGFDIAIDTTVTGISEHSDEWRRGTRGRGIPQTCDGRNEHVSSSIVGNRLRFNKGLPLGLSIGGNLGLLHGVGLWTFGAELKLALIEGAKGRFTPSFALRAASSTLVGASALSLSTLALDAIVSKEFAAAQVLRVVPYLALGAILSRAQTESVDLTPNVDALACAAGEDAVCNGAGLGASTDDLGHDRTFPTLLLARYRAVLGLWLRYRIFAFAAEAAIDLMRPDQTDSDLEHKTPRQWNVSFAPSLSF